MTTTAISIDGKLDEAAWSRAKPITDFHQQQPKEGVVGSLGPRPWELFTVPVADLA